MARSKEQLAIDTMAVYADFFYKDWNDCVAQLPDATQRKALTPQMDEAAFRAALKNGELPSGYPEVLKARGISDMSLPLSEHRLAQLQAIGITAGELGRNNFLSGSIDSPSPKDTSIELSAVIAAAENYQESAIKR